MKEKISIALPKTLHARDLTRINRAADRLNQEAEEVLEYQASEE